MRNLIAAVCALAAIVITLSGVEAVAAQQCMATAKAKALLASRHEEQMVGRGVVSQYAVTELYVSSRGSWTIMTSTAMGVSCLVAAGKNWDFAKPPKPKSTL